MLKHRSAQLSGAHDGGSADAQIDEAVRERRGSVLPGRQHSMPVESIAESRWGAEATQPPAARQVRFGAA